MSNLSKSGKDILASMNELLMLNQLKYPTKKRIIIPVKGHKKIFAFVNDKYIDKQVFHNKSIGSRTIIRISLPVSFMLYALQNLNKGKKIGLENLNWN